MNYQKNKQLSIDEINAQFGKVPPQAVDVEEAVLGALMLERDAFERVESMISEESFYKEEHQKIFQAIKSVHDKNKPIDLLLVTQELINTGMLDVVGGPMEITKLTSRVSSAAHIEFHARIIKQKSIQRDIIRMSSKIQTMAYDDTQDVDDLLTFLSMEIDALNDGVGGSDEGKSSEEVSKIAMKEIIEDCEKAKNGRLVGIPTGFYQLDKSTGGWRSPNFIILSARPGIGKTSLMLKFIIVAAKAGFPCDVYGYEMNSEDLYRIILSGEADVNRTRLRDGKLEGFDFDKISRANEVLRRLPIRWYDKADIKSGRIKSNTRKNVRAGNCAMVFVDYLQLVPPEEDRTIREQQISKISRTLKSITLSCKIPVMALSQMNRDIEKRGVGAEPVKGDLRESGSLEQDADIIIFPFKNEEEEFILKIDKHRRGKCGYVPIRANGDMTQFYDFDDSYQPEPVQQSSPSSKIPIYNEPNIF